ncbi:hypothetical protein EJ07DRAFT_135427, partial [Lizonia empirigonia]
MDWVSTSAHASKLNKDKDNNRPQAQWVTKEEREKRRANNQCLRCGGKDHFVHKCDSKPPVRPAKLESREAKVQEGNDSESESKYENSDDGDRDSQKFPGKGSWITEVAELHLDINGHKENIWAYVISGEREYDLILGRPWMDRNNVTIAPAKKS